MERREELEAKKVLLFYLRVVYELVIHEHR